MADVDTRLGRQSATCILMPFMLSPVFPSTAGIIKNERQAVTGSYSGILAGQPVSVWESAIFRGIDAMTGNYVYIVGQFKGA